MARTKIVEKKSVKRKAKEKKKIEVPVAPRIRLEPRLTPSPPKKKRVCRNSIQEREKSSECSEGIGIESASQEESFCDGNVYGVSSSDEQQKSDAFDDLSFSAVEQSSSYRAASAQTKTPLKSTENEKNSYIKYLMREQKKWARSLPKRFEWNDREWMDLATGLQVHGFSDLKKIADCVKTKSENEIQEFIKLCRKDMIYDPDIKKLNRQGNAWNTLRPEFLRTWPNVRKWRKVAYEQMLLYTRSKDYSKPVISALCKKFYEEAEDPSNSQVINIKLIYKYLMCCISGQVPPQLSGVESGIILDLIREARLMPIAYDFEEERKFLQDFKSATKFKPFQVKDEFRKRYKKVPDDVFSLNTVAVPEEVFLELSRHKRLTQSFNPLVTPVWMLQKEQEVLEKYAAESNVYVD